MLSILTFNAALLDVKILGRSVYCPVDDVQNRMSCLIPALRGIAADIVFLQEIFHHDIQDHISTQLSDLYPYSAGVIKPGLRPRLGNELLILSRWPLAAGRLTRFHSASREEKLFTSKGFFRTSVELEGLGKVDLINFHTTAGGVHAHPEDRRMEDIRSRQINQLLESIDPGQYTLVAGDLNAGPHTSAENYDQVLSAGLIDSFEIAGGTGHSWDPENKLVSGGTENQLPAQRIDHIFLNRPLARVLSPVESRIVLRGWRPGPEYTATPLSDHYGVKSVFDL